ncbi:MAG: energy transducer TonB [Gammaproteobacteria bacterium]|nr:energy transducer TonB [Gammaproteobacteria bacterium]
MSAAVTIHQTDRLGLTLFLALIVHAAVILGVGFTMEKPKPPPNPDRTLKIIVIPQPVKPEKTVKPDFLAPTSQEGDGAILSKKKPTVAPSPVQARDIPVETPVEMPADIPAEPIEPPPPKRVLTQKKEAPRKSPSTPEKVSPPRKKKRLSAQQLIASTNREISRLTTELDRKTRAYSKRLRHKRVTASTQEYKYASYLEAWRRKVENIGNLNYPDEAKRRRLYGNLVLHVALFADGSVRDINIKKSSGHKLLDDAAVRIVRLSAPFAPFPPEIREETDVIDIIRTWQFRSNNTFN